VEDQLRDQQLPPGVDPPHPMSVPFIQATVFDNSALLRVNRNILPGYCHYRHSSANGCSAATGRRASLVLPPDRANGGACIAWGGRPSDVRHVIFALGGAF
jgi:hypothetical protein